MLAITIMPGTYVQIGPDIRIYNRQSERLAVAIEAPRNVSIERSDCHVSTPSK